MAHSRLLPRLLAVCMVFLALLPLALAREREFVISQDNQGNTIWLADDRKPALYTDNFGSCLDNGLVDVTRFDAALYHDNMTLMFDIQGTTNLTRDPVMSMYESCNG